MMESEHDISTQDLNLTGQLSGNITILNGSGCGNHSEITSESLRDENLAMVEVTVLAVLLFLTLVPNSLVLAALIRSSLSRPLSRTYYLMKHICTADLMVGLFNVLPQLAWDLTFRFYGPNWLCKGVKCLQVMPLYLSSLLLCCLALDRHRAISWRRGSQVWSCRKMTRIAWVTALIMALPQAFFFYRKHMESGTYDCWANFPTFWSMKVYVLYFVSATFFIPMIVTVFCYTSITMKVWRYSRYRKGYVPIKTQILHKICCYDESESFLEVSDWPPSTVSAVSIDTVRVGRVPLVVHSMPNVPQPLSLAKMKTIKLTVVVTILFIVCHAPFCGTQLFHAFVASPEDNTYHPLSVIMLLLPSLPSCVNPWIYLCFSESLLNQLCVCMKRGLQRTKENISIGDQEPEDRRENHRRVKSPVEYNRRGFYAYQYPSTGSNSLLRETRIKENLEMAIIHTSV